MSNSAAKGCPARPTISSIAVLQSLDSLGYCARLLTDASGRREEKQQERTLLQLITAAAFGMQVMLLYFVQFYPRYAAGEFNAPDLRHLQYLAWLLATPVYLYGGSSFLTVVWIGWDEGVNGFVALRDEPNPTAREALRRLQAAGIQTVMLSGDNPRTTAAIAAELGLDEYEGNCPPAAKAERIEAWQAAGERVAMAGDGVNDAPALAQADLSVTAAGGTDVAGETSDLVLTRPDLDLIPWFVETSKRTRRIILENLGWAFAYNLVSVPLAALGIISPVIAAATMAASSLLVVGNSLRLRG